MTMNSFFFLTKRGVEDFDIGREGSGLILE